MWIDRSAPINRWRSNIQFVVQTIHGPDTSLAWYVPVLWEEDCRIQVTQYRLGGIVEQDQSDDVFSLHSIADVDCSNQLNIVDVLCLINYIFPTVTDPCDCIDRAKDVNCDTKFNIVDVVHLVNFIFSGGGRSLSRESNWQEK